MEFVISVRFSGKKTTLTVKRVYQDEYKERYLVAGSNENYIFERTLPILLRAGPTPKSSWRLIEPVTSYGKVKGDSIIRELKKIVE